MPTATIRLNPIRAGRVLGTALATLLLLLPVSPASAGSRDEPGTFLVTREADLFSRPSADARIVHVLRAGTLIQVVRVTEQWYEVHSTTGKPNGFIRRSFADPHKGRTAGGGRFREGTFRLTDPVVVRSSPDMDAPSVTTLPAGAELRVTDRMGNWYRIESERGDRPPGYIPVISAQRLN